MTLFVAEMYDALRNAGADEEHARAAVVASQGERQNKVEADLLVLKWMTGFNIALGVAIMGVLLRFLVPGAAG